MTRYPLRRVTPLEETERFLSFLLAAFAVVAGVQGVRPGLSIRSDPGKYGVGDTVLLVLGILTGLWGVGLTVMSSVLVVLTLVVSG